MSRLDQQVRQASRRLTTNVLLERLALAVLIAATAWVVVLLVERLFVLGIPLNIAIWSAMGLAAIITLIGTMISRVGRLQAAVALDGSAKLKERLSTAVACGATSGARRAARDPFAQAVEKDAEKIAGAVHVPTHLPYRAPALWPWSVAAVVAAVALGFFLPTFNLLAGDKENKNDKKQQQEAATKERQQITMAVNQQMEKINKLVESNPELKDLAKDLKPLDMPEKPDVTPDDIRRDALKQLDKVAEKLEQEKNSEKFNALEQFKNMASKLEPEKGADAGSKLSEAMRNGNFEEAKKSIEEMKKQLEEAAKNGDPQAKQQLAEMQQKLDKLADQMAKLADNKAVQKELENKAGLSEEQAKKMLEELAKMDPKQLEKELQKRLGEQGKQLTKEQIQQMAQKIAKNEEAKKACQNMAKAMAKAAQGMKKQNENSQQQQQKDGESPNAQMSNEGLNEAMAQLSEMEQAEQMMNELEANLSELKDLREGICQGQGNNSQKPGEQDQIGNQGPQWGLGQGSRIGKEKQAHNLKPSKVHSPIHQGQIIGQTLVDGPLDRGEATAQVRDAVNSAVRDATDAIEREEYPRQYEGVLRTYFDSLAQMANGQGGKGGTAADKQPAEGAKKP